MYPKKLTRTHMKSNVTIHLCIFFQPQVFQQYQGCHQKCSLEWIRHQLVQTLEEWSYYQI